jgi:hypothetical protein
MPEAADIYATAFKNASITVLARLAGWNAEQVIPFNVDSIEYSVYLLDDQDPDSRTPVAGHQGVELSPSEVVFDQLQTGPLWTVDGEGYNFRHTLDVAYQPAFTAGRRYLLEYTITPTVGQNILLRFRINVI